MKNWKLAVAAFAALGIFYGQADAYSTTTISIQDTFIGGNPAGGTDSNSTWDGKDVVGDKSYFGIDSMNVVFHDSSLSSISIFTNYVLQGHVGIYGTQLGDLFISTNGYKAADKFDTSTTGEKWEYALVLNNHLPTITAGGASGTFSLYQVSSSNVILSHAPAGNIYRNGQEVAINTAASQNFWNNVGTWTIHENEMKFSFTQLPNQLSVSDYGFHWGMSCGNDIIEGGAAAPVPEPGTMMLFGIGMLGLAVFGKRRMGRRS